MCEKKTSNARKFERLNAGGQLICSLGSWNNKVYIFGAVQPKYTRKCTIWRSRLA
jgi:hypothetical protein